MKREEVLSVMLLLIVVCLSKKRRQNKSNSPCACLLNIKVSYWRSASALCVGLVRPE
jgi:hypothetical protein